MEKADIKKLESGNYILRQPGEETLQKSRKIKEKWDNIFGFRPKSIWNIPSKANFGQNKTLEKFLFPKTVASSSYVTGNIKEGYMLVPKKKSLSQFPLELGRRLVLLYSKPHEWIFDPFSGMGERMQISSWLVRHYVGFDISKEFHKQKLDLVKKTPYLRGIRINYLRDSRDIHLGSNSTHYIYTSPPYYNVEVKAYGDEKEQLGYLDSYETFLEDYQYIISHCYRMLRPGRFCTFIVGNFRRNKKLIPFVEDTVKAFIAEGFDYHDNVVYETGTFAAMFTQPVFKFRRMGKTHEHILTFRKPGEWFDFGDINT